MKNKSFTLIELLVVIVIIGILAGVIMISTSSSIDKANIAKLKVFEGSILNNLGAGLVSQWNFDKLTQLAGSILPEDTVIVDDWGCNNGLSKSGPEVKDGSGCIKGKCLYFDGENDYISILDNSSLDLENALTMSIWLYPYSGNDEEEHPTPICKYASYKIRLYNINNTVYCGESGGVDHLPYGSTFSYEDNKWIYIVWTFSFSGSSGQIITYKDGVAKTPVITSYDIFLSDKNLLLGAASVGGRHYKGVIDEVRIYNEVLTQSQVQRQYIAGLDNLLLNKAISKKEYDLRLNELANIDF